MVTSIPGNFAEGHGERGKRFGIKLLFLRVRL
jgi:hypothetical protein